VSEWIDFPRLYRTPNTFPADKNLTVIVRFRNGHVTQPAPVKNWRWWRHSRQVEPCPFDVVAWREV